MPVGHGSGRKKGGGSRERILARIERAAGVPGLASTLANRLEPTDLQSLLLEVYALRAKSRTPADVLRDHRTNRFTGPSGVDPSVLLEWDRVAFGCLPASFDRVELSPVSPLGTVSVLTPLSQDWAVSTSRNTEVVSDATNVLAIECAARRAATAGGPTALAPPVHLAASHRVLRGQKFEGGPLVRQHFRLLSLCSAGRDVGTLRFETETADAHLRFYVDALTRFLPPRTRLGVTVIDLRSTPPRAALRTGLFDRFHAGAPSVEVRWGDPRTGGKGYYRQFRFKLTASIDGRPPVELVDGGDVDWSQKLLSNSKERMVISGCGSERVGVLSAPSQPPEAR